MPLNKPNYSLIKHAQTYSQKKLKSKHVQIDVSVQMHTNTPSQTMDCTDRQTYTMDCSGVMSSNSHMSSSHTGKRISSCGLSATS